MDVGITALIALNNMLFVFLIWVLLRSAVVLAVALGQAALFGLPLAASAEPRFWFGAPINWQTGAACLSLSFGRTGLLLNRAPVWWGIQLDVHVGWAVFTALRLSRFARAAGPIGLLVMIG